MDCKHTAQIQSELQKNANTNVEIPTRTVLVTVVQALSLPAEDANLVGFPHSILHDAQYLVLHAGAISPPVALDPVRARWPIPQHPGARGNDSLATLNEPVPKFERLCGPGGCNCDVVSGEHDVGFEQGILIKRGQDQKDSEHESSTSTVFIVYQAPGTIYGVPHSMLMPSAQEARSIATVTTSEFLRQFCIGSELIV